MVHEKKAIVSYPIFFVVLETLCRRISLFVLVEWKRIDKRMFHVCLHSSYEKQLLEVANSVKVT